MSCPIKIYSAFLIASIFAVFVHANPSQADDSSDLSRAMNPYSFLNPAPTQVDASNNAIRQIEMLGQQAIQQINQPQAISSLGTSKLTPLEVEAQARSIVARMKPLLPIKSGRDFTLVKVEQAGTLLIYSHTMNEIVPTENYSLLSDWLRGQSYKSACSVSDLVRFVNAGGTLQYRFYSNGALLNSTQIESCR